MAKSSYGRPEPEFVSRVQARCLPLVQKHGGSERTVIRAPRVTEWRAVIGTYCVIVRMNDKGAEYECTGSVVTPPPDNSVTDWTKERGCRGCPFEHAMKSLNLGWAEKKTYAKSIDEIDDAVRGLEAALERMLDRLADWAWFYKA